MNAETRAKLMRAAIEVCKRGIAAGQSPFGAAIASPGGDVVYAGHNQVRLSADPCAHAEVVAIRGACELLQTIDLSGHVMATTCEPCPMCAQAISFARIRRLTFAAYDPKGGGVEHGPRIFHATSCHHRPEIYGGIGERPAAELLEAFFAALRAG